MSVKCLVISVGFAALASACGGPAEPAKDSSTPPPSGTPSAVVVKSAPPIDLPPATANRPARGMTISDIANRPKRADSDPNAKPAPLQFRPAGENSQVALSMGTDGVVREVRIFKDHPTLARVELTLLQNGEKALKFTMTDGSVVERRTDKINDLATARSSELLAIAGR